MALEIRLGESKWWYGRTVVSGRQITRNLGVEIRGTPPSRLSSRGDEAFERSRAKAQAALERLQLDFKKRNTAEELVQAIHEIRTGGRVSTIPLKDASARWKGLPRRRPLSKRYVVQAESWMARFVSFVGERYASVYEMSQVQPAMARAFFNEEEARGVSAKTYNNSLIFLRSSFEALKEDGGIPKNPFAGIPTKEEQTIFRKPFTADELALIVNAAKTDPFIEPIIITGICTAMRRGDCCLLLKTAVDLPNRFMQVKSSKTGEVVQIPIFPLLDEMLAKRPPSDSPYVFPEQATKYQLNPDHITLRVRRVMRAAGFFDTDDSAVEPDQQSADGETPASRGEIHQARPNGLRQASVRDFHSFRVTWVTLALTAGVPLEIVQKVTGHRTASIVMKHYFQPGREEFRRTLAGKLPALIGGPVAPRSIELTEVRALVEAMRPRTWGKIREDLLRRLPKGEASETAPAVTHTPKKKGPSRVTPSPGEGQSFDGAGQTVTSPALEFAH